jgi:hypothetical protein
MTEQEQEYVEDLKATINLLVGRERDGGLYVKVADYDDLTELYCRHQDPKGMYKFLQSIID